MRRGRRATPSCTPEGILYPRAGTLGGCTAHNAMILMRAARCRLGRDRRPDRRRIVAGDRDAALLAQRLENCRHRPAMARAGAARHRSDRSWLERLAAAPSAPCRCRRWTTSRADRDDAAVGGLARCVVRPAAGARCAGWSRPRPIPTTCGNCGGRLDRHLLHAAHAPTGTARIGTRERLLDVAARYPDRLRIELHALATRVLFRRREPCDRRRVPEGRAAVPGTPRSPQAGGSPRRRPLAGARGDPGRRCVQHAAAADAVRHRSARRRWPRTAFRCGSTCPASGATCRTATRSASSTA